MKKMSIKTRLTLWYAIFIVLIVTIMISAMSLNQHRLSKDYYFEKLTAAISQAAGSVHLENGEIRLVSETDSGVCVTVLDANGKLLLGRRHFTASLKEEVLRVRGDADTDWYILDKPVTLEDGRNIWLRCYISSTLSEISNAATLKIVLWMIPILLLVVLGGGYLIIRRAFLPLDEISRTAESISNSSDLKQRIALVDQSDEVGRLADTFDGMFERLENSLESEKRFISDASHELRTPLSVICSQSEYALMEGRSTEEKDEALKIILERGRKTSRMLSRMLMLSRMDFQRLPVQMENIDLSALVECLAQEMQAKADHKNIRVESDIEEGIHLHCDEILIMQMLSNLVENAIQYGRDGGFVRIQLSSSRKCVTIRVQDNGVGIDKAEQSKIWRRFYQAGGKREGTVGAGLGLSIVKSIAEIHGADIHLHSKKGEGSRFTVELPIK